MAIRLQDIANDLNLSKMTISKVLRGQADVSAETKARVLKRMQELNYRPNISARGLRTGQTFTIGLTVPDLSNPFVAQIAAGIQESAQAREYSVVITTANGDPDQEEHEVELQLSRQVDALLLCLRSDVSDLPSILETTTVPIALIGHAPPRFNGISAGVREPEVGQFAVQHLLKSGCKRIAYLRGPRTPVGDLRFNGFLEAMRSADVPVKQEWIVESHPGDAGYRSGLEAAQRLLSARLKPDGLIAYTDAQAIGVREAAIATGPACLRQLQVIGCGNSFQAAEMGLTSIDLPYREIGKRAARMLIKMIDEKEQPSGARTILLSPRIVARGIHSEERKK